MVREAYLWVAFVIIIAIIASYFRFYYKPGISINLSIGHRLKPSMYPYQELSIPIVITNTGNGPFSNLPLGLYINGVDSRVYKASIPAGKEATLYFNYTPTRNGTYNITIIADPGRLYDINDRQNARAGAVIDVLKPENADPYAAVSANGLLGADSFNMSASGYEVSSYLYGNFSADKLELTGSQKVNDLIYPALDVYAPYIEQIAG